MSVIQRGGSRAVDGAGRWVRRGSTIVLDDPFEPFEADGEVALLEVSGAPKKPRIPTKTVVLRATLKFDRDVALALGRSMPKSFYAVNIPRPASRGSVPTGPTGVQAGAHIGYVPKDQDKQNLVMLQPAPGSREVELVAWNSGQPVRGTASSHAEAFFVYWLKFAQLRGLKEMHVRINLSPCSLCAGKLADNSMGVNPHLTYFKPFEGWDRYGILYDNTTTVEDLAGLKGWTVSPSSPRPRWTNATKAAEIEAGKLRSIRGEPPRRG